jgi:cation-transporting ATPase E
MTTSDLIPSLLSQIKQWLLSLGEAPYSAVTSNVLLVLIACALAILGIFASWITRHPDEFLRVIAGWRTLPVVSQADRYLRLGLAFLLRRFDVASTYGLSFTLALAVLFVGIWFFGSALEDILAYNGTALFDVPIASFVALHRLSWLTAIMQAIGVPGSGCVAIAVALGAVLYALWRTRGWQWPTIILAGIAGAEILDLAMRLFVARPGPPVAWMATSASTCGFVPGQTVTSVLYGFVAYLIAARQPTWQGKIFAWSGAVMVAFLIGIARIYLGTDWFTDILSRWALALLWFPATLLVATIIEQLVGATVTAPAELELPASATEGMPPESSLIVGTVRPEVPINGLSEIEVMERRQRGEDNTVREQTSRTVTGILRANVFTRFNALLGGLFVVILLISGKQDALFGLILIANTAIGVGQELRAKRTLDRLRVLVAPRAHVVRGGVSRELPVDQIVIDDVLDIRSGDQVPVDGVVLATQALEINESLLTGEADPIAKARGDQVLSGSFVVAGGGRVQAIRVGEAAYSRQLALAARKFGLARSQLRDGINDILRYVTWALIPTATVLFTTQLLYSPAGARDAAASSIAGVVGMVPEGLVLLTSTVMATAVVRLARQGALLQELAAAELLARVDVVCADKTGTLTEGVSTVEDVIPARVAAGTEQIQPSIEVRSVLGAFAHNEGTQSSTSIALQTACPRPSDPRWNIVSSVPFSSTRKWSGLSFAGGGSWILGAPDIVLQNVDSSGEVLATVDKVTRGGKRVLALASSKEPLDTTASAARPMSIEPEALIVFAERVREDVAATIRYFEEQGVSVKVISGDHAETVQSIANLAGLRSQQRAMDARSLPADPHELGRIVDQNNLFGRVTPSQKRLIVRALHDRGHVVAMIGDGTNDALAIKEADFGIALGSGTPASRAVAQLILLNNSFAALPPVIAEGRRVIANVERTANLFITKTIYVFALALAIGIAQAPFPFLPRHLTLVGILTIGVPGLLLSFARTTTVARPGFLSRILRFAFPAGAIAAAMTLVSYAAARALVPNDTGLARTAATLALVGCGFSILWLLTRPQRLWQWVVLSALPAMLGIIMLVRQLRDFFALQLPPLLVWAAVTLIVAASTVALLLTESFNHGKVKVSAGARAQR